MIFTEITNILPFLLFGALLPLLFNCCRRILPLVTVSLCFSLAIELTRYLTSRGLFAVDDVMLNVLGAVCGYFIFVYIHDGILAIKNRSMHDAKKQKKFSSFPKIYTAGLCVRYEGVLVAIQILAVLLQISVIMGFSSDTGNASRAWSRPIACAVARVISLFSSMFSKNSESNVPKITDMASLINSQSLYIDRIEAIVRKIAHVTEYAILAFLVWVLAYSRPYIKRYVSYLSGLLLVLLIGFLDEFNQLHVTGRSGSLIDVLIDLSGAILALTAAFILSRLVAKKPQ